MSGWGWQFDTHWNGTWSLHRQMDSSGQLGSHSFRKCDSFNLSFRFRITLRCLTLQRKPSIAYTLRLNLCTSGWINLSDRFIWSFRHDMKALCIGLFSGGFSVACGSNICPWENVKFKLVILCRRNKRIFILVLFSTVLSLQGWLVESLLVKVLGQSWLRSLSQDIFSDQVCFFTSRSHLCYQLCLP